jgi:hypothetical protein
MARDRQPSRLLVHRLGDAHIERTVFALEAVTSRVPA